MKQQAHNILVRIMQTVSVFIIGSFITLTFVSVYNYYTSIPGQTDCMLTYVREGYTHGYIYRFPSGNVHVDGKQYTNYRIGTINGCVVNSDSLILSVANTHYCVTTHILEHKF